MHRPIIETHLTCCICLTTSPAVRRYYETDEDGTLTDVVDACDDSAACHERCWAAEEARLAAARTSGAVNLYDPKTLPF